MAAPSLKNVAGYKELMTQVINGSTRSVLVKNNTGSTIAKGSAVYFNGSDGALPTVAPARANAVATMPAVGVMQNSVPNGAAEFCQFSGQLENVNTSGFANGDRLYTSAASAGVLTNVEPVHPNLSQIIAVVVSSNTSGSIFIFPCLAPNGQELGTISNTFRVGDAAAGTKSVLFINANTGTLSWTPTGSRTLTLPDATDTLTGKATTDTLTNKTYDTAGAGNVFRINGTAISAITGTGSAVLSTTPTLVTPVIGVASGTSLALSGGFGCNTKAAQGAYAIGAALNAYAAGANGLSAGADMSALVAKVSAIHVALIANGICSV